MSIDYTGAGGGDPQWQTPGTGAPAWTNPTPTGSGAPATPPAQPLAGADPFGQVSPGLGQQPSFMEGIGGLPQADLQVPPGKPPMPLLIAPIALAAIAGALALVFTSLPLIIACWVLAGPVAVALLALFVSKDQAARSRPTYLGAAWLAKAPMIVGLLIIIAVGLTAFGVGRWVYYA